MFASIVLAIALPASSGSSGGVLPERRQECTSTTAPALSAQALVEELSRASLAQRTLAEAQQKLKADQDAVVADRAALDAARAQLDADKKAFAREVSKEVLSTKTTAKTEAAKSAVVKVPETTKPEPVPAKPQATADVGKIAKTLGGMKAAKAGAVLAQLEPAVAAQVVMKMKREQAAAALETLPPAQAAKIATSMSSGAQ